MNDIATITQDAKALPNSAPGVGVDGELTNLAQEGTARLTDLSEALSSALATQLSRALQSDIEYAEALIALIDAVANVGRGTLRMIQAHSAVVPPGRLLRWLQRRSVNKALVKLTHKVAVVHAYVKEIATP
ncbi:hypothetical protein [Promicromonospora sp. NPDC057488]|uniref:hypothetical protein n=1 Tax=Promicromonospora sp. NPDC057488 TaxID=3346147 RepID=UPI00366BD6BD